MNLTNTTKGERRGTKETKWNAFEQGLLRYLSEAQLRTIQSVKVGIGGAGGLGSNVAMILVRSGFNKIEILDQDVIEDRKSTRLNSSHGYISYAVFCLKKKKERRSPS